MKHAFVTFAECATFILILIFSLVLINKTLQPKYYFATNTGWPSTSTFRQFYQMDKNSVDVLFLGSSVAVNNFIPQQLYNDYGIRSYNLASEQQNVLLSYYWLKEALQYQTPKLVVLEAFFLQNLHGDLALNTSEGLTRKAIDPMRWSPVKWEAVHDICQRDPSQTVMSYLFTNIRYHGRWKELESWDFITEDYSKPVLFGWAPGQDEYIPVEPFEESDEDTSCQLREDMVEYFEKMVSLCNEKGIRLILVKVPQSGKMTHIDYAYRKLAEQYGIDYYNFLEKSLYDRMKVDTATEWVASHGNLSGNYKNSALLGEIIAERYAIPCMQDEQYEKTRIDYSQMCTSFSVNRIEDIDEYLRAVNKPDYIVMISVKDEAVRRLKESTKNILRGYGSAASWEAESMLRCAYTAVLENGIISEETSMMRGGDPLVQTGSFHNSRNRYVIKSAGFEDKGGAVSSIMINGVEYSMNSRGLNIVVYDKLLEKVIDSVSFDTNTDSSAKRKDKS